MHIISKHKYLFNMATVYNRHLPLTATYFFINNNYLMILNNFYWISLDIVACFQHVACYDEYYWNPS